VRVQLSLVLLAVVSQQLIPTVDGNLAPAMEVMLVTPAISNMIRRARGTRSTTRSMPAAQRAWFRWTRTSCACTGAGESRANTRFPTHQSGPDG
jgi:Tfp pilus assembly pilus retraction ATPase PilT